MVYVFADSHPSSSNQLIATRPGSRTNDLAIVSPTPYRYTTKPLLYVCVSVAGWLWRVLWPV